jgi:EAL domain-containing protein (putative c-di-GMP-specific phosphodiesterase class I)
VDDYDAVTTAFTDLREMGAQLAVDDTGAGYASFRHLLGLDPSIVKLDMSLTRGIDRDSARRALAAALVSFTRDTDRVLVAEGVETAAELEALRELGVRLVQGYYLGRPQRLADLVSAHAGS